MKVGSLFSGIGGFDLGLERAGMEVIWQVENDPFCQKVLKKHWPDIPCYGDIKEIDFTKLERPDLVCGGFPCPPVSVAGKARGENDSRWLWPEMYRAICEIKPRIVLAENVPGLLSVKNGRLFAGILRDLASIGYNAEWDMLSACSFGAPHTRERVFIIAYPTGNRFKRNVFKTTQEEYNISFKTLDSWHQTGSPFEQFKKLMAESGAIRMADGVSSTVDIRPRIRAYGNAVVPQVAEWIGRRILAAAERR